MLYFPISTINTVNSDICIGGRYIEKKSFFSSLTVKIPTQLIALLLIIIVSLSSAVVYMSQKATTDSINSEVNYLAQMNAAKVYSYLDNMNAFSHSLSKEVRHYSSLDRVDAEPILIETLEGVLGNDKIFGAYFAFDKPLFPGHSSRPVLLCLP